MRLQSWPIPESGPEAELVRRTQRHFDHRGHLTAREVGTGYGVADLVAYRIAPSRARARLENDQDAPLTRVEHFKLLLALPELGSGAMDLEEAAELVNLSPDHTRRALLDDLSRKGYVAKVRPRHYAKVNGFMPLAWEVAAIEAKVRNWKKGAIQAKRYRLFAHRVYLAIDDDYLNRVDRELLRTHGIGLLSVSEDTVRRVFGSPREGPRSTAHLNLACEAIWTRNEPRVELRQGASGGSS